MARLKSAMTKDGRLFQLYKLKFSNNEAIRKKLFTELQGYNDKLKKLLDSSDQESQLIQQRALVKEAKAVDNAICNFWVQAATLFKTLAAAWKCRCTGQHFPNLLLQHPTSKPPEFEFLFVKSLPSDWEIKRSRIAQGDDMVSSSSFMKGTVALTEKRPLHQPGHKTSQPVKSAMKGKNSATWADKTLKCVHL